MSNKCQNCKYWYTNKGLQDVYGEGEGKCRVLEEITFCEKHNCPFFSPKEVVNE